MVCNNQIKIAQCNIDKSRNSQHEFLQSFSTGDCQIALLSEPYVGSGNELKSIKDINIYQYSNGNRVKACILVKPGFGSILGLTQFSSANLCVVQLNTGNRNVLLASVYVEPDEDSLNTLEHLDYFLKSTSSAHRIVGGDLNGWHSLWGSARTNLRGREVMDIIYGNDMYICNTGSTPTFETVTHGRQRTSVIDITIASDSIYDRVSNWRVNLDFCTTSQHNAIEFTINANLNKPSPWDNTSTFRYKVNKACWPVFKDSLDTSMALTDILERNVSKLDSLGLETLIDDITGVIHLACEKSMHTRGSGQGQKIKPLWWSDRLENMKKEVIEIHRKITTAKRQGAPLEELLDEQQMKKKLYAEELRYESTKNFRELCELQTKENVWSMTNRLLKQTTYRRPPTTLKVGGRYTNNGKETAQALLDHFYPDDLPDTEPRHHNLRAIYSVDSEEDTMFAEKEILEHLQYMNPNKAPGVDHLTSDICLKFFIAYPKLITEIMNRCLTLRYFPRQWKIAYAKIIPKPGKLDYSELGSFRPIGLLPVFGKLLEKLFIKRVTYWAAKRGFSNERQFGFREQTSTVQAIENAIRLIRQAKTDKQLVVAVSLDIKAAFDNAWWPALFHRLRRMNCPKNIYGLIEDYVRDREVRLDHAGERVSKRMTKGCIQGSACGPILWNIILDELLEMKLPSGCHIQAFADDVLLIVTASNVGELKNSAENALAEIVNWGKGVKLTFGPEKTQIIAFSPKAKNANIFMEGRELSFERQIKMLGVILDEKLLFGPHVKYIIEKAMRIFNKLCMYTRPTYGAHPENVRLIYQRVIEPIITYGAGIWGQAVSKKYVKKALLSMQRGFAIKAIRGFRTVSTTAAIALAQFMPLDLKIREIHTLERTRLCNVSDYLPHDIQLEIPSPVHELLHPAKRISFTPSDYIEEENTDMTLIYTDGSKQDDDSVGAAFVCFDPGGTTPKATRRFKLHDCCTVFQAELFAILGACQWAAHHQLNNTFIFTDSLSSIKALENRSNTHPIAAQIHQTIHLMVRESQRINISWVKGHSGNLGNEFADSAANTATRLHRAAQYSRFPLSYIKAKIRRENYLIWEARYASSPTGQHTKRLLPTLQDIKDLGNVCKTTFHLTQMLTGHGFHKAYLKRFHITEDDHCPCDGVTQQSMEHLLETCPVFGVQRFDHERRCDSLIVSPYNIKEIITKESCIDSYIGLVTTIINRLKELNKT